MITLYPLITQDIFNSDPSLNVHLSLVGMSLPPEASEVYPNPPDIEGPEHSLPDSDKEVKKNSL